MARLGWSKFLKHAGWFSAFLRTSSKTFAGNSLDEIFVANLLSLILSELAIALALSLTPHLFIEEAELIMFSPLLTIE